MNSKGNANTGRLARRSHRRRVRSLASSRDQIHRRNFLANGLNGSDTPSPYVVRTGLIRFLRSCVLYFSSSEGCGRVQPNLAAEPDPDRFLRSDEPVQHEHRVSRKRRYPNISERIRLPRRRRQRAHVRWP